MFLLEKQISGLQKNSCQMLKTRLSEVNMGLSITSAVHFQMTVLAVKVSGYF